MVKSLQKKSRDPNQDWVKSIDINNLGIMFPFINKHFSRSENGVQIGGPVTTPIVI